MENALKSHVIIIGNGMVGYKVCEKLIKKTGSHSLQITVFGEESRPAYDRVHLSEYFSGKTADDLNMVSADWYAKNNINLHISDPIIDVNRNQKIVHSHTGISLHYDFLIFATGSSAFVPAIPGVEKNGVFVYRTIEDLEMMQAHAKKARIGAVLGGGLLGLEAAKALLDLGLSETHVIEFAPKLMPRQIDDGGSEILRHKLQELGLSIHLSKSTKQIYGEKSISAMQFNDDSKLAVDMLVISAGIKPRDELAQKIGLEIGPRGGICVDDNLKTSDNAIFAIGECALHQNIIYGLVAPGYEMAEIVAEQIINVRTPKLFTGFDISTKLKLIGVDVGSFGNPFVAEPDAQTIVFENKAKGIYKRINIDTVNNRLLGGILIGDAEQYNMLHQMVVNKMPLPANPEDLILGTRGGEHTSHGVLDLPDEALICSCEAITKGILCHEIIENQTTNLEGLKKSTKACTGCGGCTPMVKDLIQSVLKSQGLIVRNLICEHFDYTRQELLDLIKMGRHKTFSEVISQEGKGKGCEVCKPVVSSLLASLWNENILDKGRDTAQDSNDRFLANIQRGGTYSVVPRIPGGEITPQKLIIIGQVAEKYGLYTKITGGQRIDLFGAHLGDLPAIWEELIAAGFESGHAYGKSLRTVKSCVGTTWCRFGVQDAVSFAIEVENRYKGLRSPHKLKSAVSGCIRECAEAQSKDFGIIATEKGWNLYVCGNGGSKPRHAELIATDLSSAETLKIIDRFLMFYIKTAEPLQRTAPWLDKMEGGLAYLKSVIIDDILGICENLEAEMDTIVGTYKCEWKEAVETPKIRSRFVHFVNAPSLKDPNVKFTELREQIIAEDWNKSKN